MVNLEMIMISRAMNRFQKLTVDVEIISKL